MYCQNLQVFQIILSRLYLIGTDTQVSAVSILTGPQIDPYTYDIFLLILELLYSYLKIKKYASLSRLTLCYSFRIRANNSAEVRPGRCCPICHRRRLRYGPRSSQYDQEEV